MRLVFPLLYWFGLILALIGVGLRFWMDAGSLGLAVAVAGVALLLFARLAQRLRH
ncbi:MAG TPA: hypothetical protein VFP94_06380 [Terriglobales bacterium]|nr:hypothetical protein [Terriglobales bacterium]